MAPGTPSSRFMKPVTSKIVWIRDSSGDLRAFSKAKPNHTCSFASRYVLFFLIIITILAFVLDNGSGGRLGSREMPIEGEAIHLKGISFYLCVTSVCLKGSAKVEKR